MKKNLNINLTVSFVETMVATFVGEGDDSLCNRFL